MQGCLLREGEVRLLIPRIGLSLVQGCLLREGEVRLLVPPSSGGGPPSSVRLSVLSSPELQPRQSLRVHLVSQVEVYMYRCQIYFCCLPWVAVICLVTGL